MLFRSQDVAPPFDKPRLIEKLSLQLYRQMHVLSLDCTTANVFVSVDDTPSVVGDASASPRSFTYTSGYDVLKVVRIDTKITGENIEDEWQALNSNYHELSMDNQLQYDVST